MESESVNRKETKRRKKKVKKKKSKYTKQSFESGSKDDQEEQKREKLDQTKDEELIAGRYEVNKNMLLGKGSFGEIYLISDSISRKFFALKKEFQRKTPQLKIEKNVLDMMEDFEGYANAYEYGSHQDWNFLVMDLLGPSLSDLFQFCGLKFTLQTILLIAIQLIQRIQDLHAKNFIHRDIKPENFLIGVGEKTNIVHIIDFGLAKKFKNSKTMEHIPYKETRILTGTARYASINNHLGIEQSRRDDLEAIGYVLIYLFRRRLPWQGVNGSSQNAKYKKILEKKLSITVELLCKDLPFEIATYMNYVKNLRFDERPDYNFLKGIFTNLLISQYNPEFIFDWFLDVPILEAPNRKEYLTIMNKLRKSRKTMTFFKSDKLINTNSEVNIKNVEVEQEKLVQDGNTEVNDYLTHLKACELEKNLKPNETNLEVNMQKDSHSNQNSGSFSSISDDRILSHNNEVNEDVVLVIDEEMESNADNTIELGSDTDRTENNDNIDGNDFLLIVEDFYPKKITKNN